MFLETVSDRSYEAAHPITLDEATVADVLRGVHTQRKTGLTLLLGAAARSADPSAARTFFEDDIALLAPHLTAALAQAASNQRIGFRLSYAPATPTQVKKGEPNVETTSGYLFADSLSLHITMTQYRYMPNKRPKRIMKEPRPLPDTDGMRDVELVFIPETALRPFSYDKPSWELDLFGSSKDRTLIVDYQLLTKLLAAPPQPVPASTPKGAPTHSAPAPSAPAASEVELGAFREELRALQKKLEEQSAELERLKKSSP